MKRLLIVVAMSAFLLRSDIGAVEPIQTSQPAVPKDGRSKIKIMTAAQLKKAGLDMGKPSAKGILAVWADCANLEDYPLASCSVDEFIEITYGKGKGHGIAATINIRCQMDPVNIFVIYPVAKGYLCQLLDGANCYIGDIGDLNGDKVPEIMFGNVFGNTSRQNPFSMVDIYSWTPDGFVKNNRAFLESYYIPVSLPEITDRLAKATAMLEHSAVPERGTAQQVEAAAVERKEAFGMLKDCREALAMITAMGKPLAPAGRTR